MRWTGVVVRRAKSTRGGGRRPESFAVALAAGAAAGTAFGAGGLAPETRETLFALLEQFGRARAQAGVAACASGAFLSSFLLMLTLFAAGFCAWSLPVAFLVPFFRGVGFGFTCANLYLRYGAGAFGYSLCCLFPDLLLSGLLLCIAASSSARLSGAYLSALTGGDGRLPQREELRRYCGTFLALLTAAAAAALVGAVVAGIYPAKPYM